MNQLFDYIQSSSAMVMQQIVNEDIIPIMLDVIRAEVYDVYEPKVYERRFANDGLLDQTNFDVQMDISKDFIQATVRNTTRPNDKSEGRYLDIMILEGTPNMPMERDFYEATRLILRERLPQIVKERFARYGIKADLKVSVK